MALHPLVAGFAEVADAYERGRPGYPPAVIAALGLPAGARVADVGAGTGKLTRALVAGGFDVVAVEPLPGLRAALSQAVPGASVVEGKAEALPLEDASVDAVVCADAYHWFDGPRAVAEFARVLRSAGTLALLWNWEADEEDPPAWRAELWELAGSIRPAHPSLDGGDQGRGAVDASAAFGTLSCDEVVHAFATSRARIVDQFASMSWVGAMHDDERAAMLGRVDAILAKHGVEDITVPLKTLIWSTHRV
jgi:SAM-dependent methyltransferase